ncbi:hypothetical protein I306_02882 [Cryptococcus gattii EJB2]|uniref:Secreted protein n=1 Tax=Cryptococcus gattii EJB2 TaxID=1296103 RepID=A0ABR5BW90_9TREE|nr:hypothetical protein I306_02882 [Cryptococcus gattii EJB2]
MLRKAFAIPMLAAGLTPSFGETLPKNRFSLSNVAFLLAPLKPENASCQWVLALASTHLTLAPPMAMIKSHPHHPNSRLTGNHLPTLISIICYLMSMRNHRLCFRLGITLVWPAMGQ